MVFKHNSWFVMVSFRFLHGFSFLVDGLNYEPRSASNVSIQEPLKRKNKEQIMTKHDLATLLLNSLSEATVVRVQSLVEAS